MTISTIEELTDAIMSEQFTDNQIKKIIETALIVLFIHELPDRIKLAEMVTKFLEEYPSGTERPLFLDIGKADLDVKD